MKRILYIISILTLSVSQCYGWMLTGSGGVTAGGGAGTPAYQWDFEDNAANTTVAATEGSTNGVTTTTNTTTLNTSSGCLDGDCFDLANGAAQERFRVSLPLSWYDDGVFTVQMAIKIPSTETVGSGTRILLTEGTKLTLVLNSDTALLAYFGGTYLGEVTINDVSTSSWHVLRFVYDTGASDKFTVYQGATEGALSKVGTALTTSFGAQRSADPYLVSFWGNTTTAQSLQDIDAVVDQIKIWTTAEAP